MKKICFFGGTFNPVHLGHTAIVKKLQETNLFDEIIVVPNGDAPHKKNEINKSDRLNMVKLAFSDINGVAVSDYEVKKETLSYTYETLEYFKTVYPDSELYFVMGMDSLVGINKWKNPEKICQLATIVVFGRSGFYGVDEEIESVKEKYNARIIKIDFDFICSSTDIRNKIRNGDYIFDCIHPDVFLYILKNGLYETENISCFDNFEKEVKKHVDEKRFRHSLGVAMVSYLLAVKNGENAKDAYFAGLVHDIAKKMPYEKQLKYAKGIKLSKDEKMIKKMLHAPAGAGFLRKEYNIKDNKILNAVRLHTKGEPDMSLFDKIIYLADFIEPYREYEGVENLRKTTFYDIDEGIIEACDNTIRMLLLKKGKIAPCLLDLRNSFL